MKANRKFLNGDDEAVSPVIAVILMVAITVVLAATVYVWVSGFGGQSGSSSKTMSLTSAGAQDSTTFIKAWTVASASPGLRYQDMSVMVGSTVYTFATTCTPGNGAWSACAGSTTRASTDLVSAGDTIRIDATATQIGSNLVVTDTGSNSVLVQITVAN